jgi:hypothetical protein
MQQTWKVQLFVAHDKPKAIGNAADAIDTFGVQADTKDEARAAARKWLEDRGHKVRSVNFTTVRFSLVAYVAPKAN